MARLGFLGLAMGVGCGCGCGCWCRRCKGSLMTKFSRWGYSLGPEWHAGIGYLSGGRTLLTRSRQWAWPQAAAVDTVRFLCNLYFRFFQCKILIFVYKPKLASSALFWTVLVSMNQEFL